VLLVMRGQSALSIATAVGAMGCGPIVIDAIDVPDAAVESLYVDRCPTDPAKTQPGVCGCGVPDDDLDGDMTADCAESCPDNPARTQPVGACGCSGLDDEDGCNALRAALRNLYTFNGTGGIVIDSLGGRNGRVLHAVEATLVEQLDKLQMNGRLNLDGSGSYVELPAGLLAGLTSATFEVWMTWRGGSFWARVFDFGSDDGGNQPSGETYLFLTPSNGNSGALRAAMSAAGVEGEVSAEGEAALPVAGTANGAPEHVAVVVDEATSSLQLYAAGALVGSAPLMIDLTAIDDVNDWLGRSNFRLDPPFYGSLIEFRIYEQALTAQQIRASFLAGPGALD
jgi:hypothetical protein